MPAGLLLKKLIDGEQIWRKWHGTYDEKPPMSLAEIYNEFQMTNNVNPATGKPVTRAGLCDSAWRWAMKNVEMAMPMVIAAYEAQGEVTDEEHVKRLFVKRARHVFQHSTNTYRKFIDKYQLQDYQ